MGTNFTDTVAHREAVVEELALEGNGKYRRTR